MINPAAKAFIKNSREEYKNKKPFPYLVVDNVFDEDLSLELKKHIINLPKEKFDRYQNPFEQKWTLRDKFDFNDVLKYTFRYFEGNEFLSLIKDLVGFPVEIEEQRNYWGVHLFKNGDKLDIHTDAGIHPPTNKKKHVTVGYYLTLNWKPEYGGDLEIWNGDSVTNYNPKLYSLHEKIEPINNRMVIFTNTDYAWHGAPNQVKCADDAVRIFITISYISDKEDLNGFVYRNDMENIIPKARFVGRPNIDSFDEEIEELRRKRATVTGSKEVYNILDKNRM